MFFSLSTLQNAELFFFYSSYPLVPRQWIGSALVPIMACRLFGAKPLSKPVLGYQLDHQEPNSVKFESEFIHFHSRKCIWKCSLPEWRQFCPGGDKLKAIQLLCRKPVVQTFSATSGDKVVTSTNLYVLVTMIISLWPNDAIWRQISLPMLPPPLESTKFSEIWIITNIFLQENAFRMRNGGHINIIQAKARCRQTTSNHLNQCWPRSPAFDQL